MPLAVRPGAAPAPARDPTAARTDRSPARDRRPDRTGAITRKNRDAVARSRRRGPSLSVFAGAPPGGAPASSEACRTTGGVTERAPRADQRGRPAGAPPVQHNDATLASVARNGGVLARHPAQRSRSASGAAPPELRISNNHAARVARMRRFVLPLGTSALSYSASLQLRCNARGRSSWIVTSEAAARRASAKKKRELCQRTLRRERRISTRSRGSGFLRWLDFINTTDGERSRAERRGCAGSRTNHERFRQLPACCRARSSDLSATSAVERVAHRTGSRLSMERASSRVRSLRIPTHAASKHRGKSRGFGLSSARQRRVSGRSVSVSPADASR